MNFESYYGKIADPRAPHEGGRIWNRWFPRENKEGFNYTDEFYLSSLNKRIIHNTIACYTNKYQLPFLNKNVKNSVRIRALNDIFPCALFIKIERNKLDNAISLYKMRKDLSHEIDSWISVMPREIEYLETCSPYEQIVGQIYYIEKTIQDDINSVGKHRLLKIQYEDLCFDTYREMEKIHAFLNQFGIHIKKDKINIPHNFEIRNKKDQVTSDVQRKLKRIIHQYYDQ
jgi:hypothetical protein